MSLSSYNGQSNFTIKGKKFLKRGANNIYDIASVAGTSGNFSTGWVNTDGTTTVANGANLNFNHNLGTTDLTVAVYVSSSSSGANIVKVDHFVIDLGSNFLGAQVQDVTTTQLNVQLGAGGFVDVTSSGGTTGSFASKYIKVVVSAGASGGGSGNIVANLKGKGYGSKIFGTSSDPVNFPHIGQAATSSGGSLTPKNFIVFQNKTDSWAILGFDPAGAGLYSTGSQGVSYTTYWKVNANDLSPTYGANSPVSLGAAFGASQSSGNEMIYHYCLIEPQAAFGMPVFMGQYNTSHYEESSANILASLGSYDGDALKAQYDASNLSSVWSELNMNSGNTLYICDTY